jgi:hypothetical protein
MKVINLTIIFLLCLLWVNVVCFADSKIGNVKDNNNGNKGYILINSGQREGNNDIGHWTDIKTIPELKGERGGIGATGQAGIDGKDVDPKEVKKLDNSIDGVNNRVSKLERIQFVLETSFRILDTKRIILRPFFRQNFTRNKIDVAGLKIDIKLCRSYEEKLIEKINNRLDLLEKTIGNTPVIEKVIDKKGNIKSISIIGKGLKVSGKF